MIVANVILIVDKNFKFMCISIPTHNNAKFDGFFHNTIFTLHWLVEFFSDRL